MTGAPTALIAEDEAPLRHELRAMLATLWPELLIVAECEDGLEALEAFAATSPDIAFLDIRMPGLNGLEVARQAATAAQIVFVTAYDAFAVSAFEAGAVDYLLKPVRADRLAATIERLRSRRSTVPIDFATLGQALAGQFAPPRPISWITANLGDTVRMIPVEDVLFFQSEDKYTRVATADDSAHIRMPLKELMARLDSEIFWRVHRNAIIRVSAILQVKPDEDGRLHAWLKGVPEPIRISDAFRHRFRAM
ncbi:MAG: LytTR family DNA-binding domain-containing protein [Sphingomonas sp.]